MRSSRNIILTKSELFLTPELPFYINRVSESYKLEEHRHDFLEFSYVSEGHGWQYIEGSAIKVSKGDVFFIPQGASHVFRPATSPTGRDSELVVYNCIFNEWFIEQLLEVCKLDSQLQYLLLTSYPKQPWLHIRNSDHIFRPLFNSMYEEYRQQKSSFMPMIQAEIIRLLVTVHRMELGTEGLPEANLLSSHSMTIEHKLDLIAKRIHRQSAEAIAVASCAAEVGLSERQFRRRFTTRHGMTFSEYVHKCRIEKSCDLLIKTGNKVADIAAEAGYQDMKFFNRLFKKKTGMTPSQYRSRNRQSCLAAYSETNGCSNNKKMK